MPKDIKNKNPKYQKIGDIEVSIYADKSGFERDLEVAQAIYDFDQSSIKLPPLSNPMIFLGKKNPDYLIREKRADRKTPAKQRLKLSLRSAKKQDCEIVVFDLSEYPSDFKTFVNILSGSFQRDEAYPKIQEFYIIDKRGRVYHYIREELKKARK